MTFVDFPTPTPIFPVLPPLAWSVHKKPILASRVYTGSSGRDLQLACAVFPRWSFILTYGGSSWLREQTQNITPDTTLAGFTELEKLSGLYLACKGPYGEFYYEDPDDNSRLNQGEGVGNGVATTFPVYVNFGFGPFSQPFYYPVGGVKAIGTVYFDGVPISPTLYSLDATNTQLIFVSAPGNGVVITMDFLFYFRCRFLDDNLDFYQFDRNLWEGREVRFESVKP